MIAARRYQVSRHPFGLLVEAEFEIVE